MIEGFLGLLDLSRDFLGIQNNLKICGNTFVSQLHSSANRYNTNIQFKNIQCFLFFYVISFNGLIFGAGIFGGFDLFPIGSSPSLEIWSTPPGHMI